MLDATDKEAGTTPAAPHRQTIRLSLDSRQLCTLTIEPGHRSQDVELGHCRQAPPGVYQQGSYGLGHTESGFINNNMDAPFKQLNGRLSK
jgi:hypothetical protein